MLDRLQKLTSILGTFIILNGTLYLYIFYKQFGLNIFSYLDFTEVLTAFLNYAPNILFFFCVYLVHLFFPFLLIDKLIDWLNVKFPNYTFTEQNKKHVKRGFSIAFYIQVLLLIVVIILLQLDYWKFSDKLIYLVVLLSMNILQKLIDFFDKSIKSIIEEQFYNAFIYAIVGAVPFTAFTILFAYSDSFQRKAESQSITLIDNQGKSESYNDNYKLIGKTNHYIFIYNTLTKESISISLTDIKTIKYN